MFLHITQKYLINCSIILISTILSLLLAESLATIYDFLKTEHLTIKADYSTPIYKSGFSILGVEPIRNTNTIATKSNAYRVNYSIDQYGRRAGCADNSSAKDSALFFGCSYTFGEGVNSKETLPCQFQSLNPDFKSYNFGFMGYGPQQMYLKLKETSWAAGITQSNSILIYTFMDSHINRLIVNYSTYSWFGAKIPVVDWDANQIKYLGPASEALPIRVGFFDLLSRSSLFKHLKIDIPLSPGEQDYKLFSEILDDSRQIFLSRFPAGRFIVLIYPDSKLTSNFIIFLQSKKIEYIDLSGYKFNSEIIKIPGDGHPTASAYSELAEQLSSRIDITVK